MISVCIPVYNLNVTELVFKLVLLRKKLPPKTIEILLIDDGSDAHFCQKNQILTKEIDKFIFLEKNIGRSAIRNRFLRITQHDYLLFLDCDSMMIREDFLSKYLVQITENQIDVLCGGNDYPNEKPPKSHQLRWYYSHAKESRVARSKKGNLGFMTNNFLIKKQLLAEIKFDESLTQYGHEDTLLGYELKKRKIEIIHFDNPVMNDVLDSNQVFIEKTERSLENLVKISKNLNNETDFIKEVKILKFYFLAKKIELTPFLSIFYKIFGRFLRKKFIEGSLKNLVVFDFYKLMYLNDKGL